MDIDLIILSENVKASKASRCCIIRVYYLVTYTNTLLFECYKIFEFELSKNTIQIAEATTFIARKYKLNQGSTIKHIDGTK